MSKRPIPYAKHTITQEDIEAVTEVLRSGLLTQGPVVPLFEKLLAERCHAGYATVCNSATSALHLACLALDLSPGDIAWTSAITFVASANCALYCGAKIDFVDIDPETSNLCPHALEEKLREAAIRDELPKVLIVVHMGGLPADMESIHRLSRVYDFKIIEDASHAIGSKYFKTITGSCTYSDITVFSFHPAKIITTGEGGAALTNRRELATRMQLLRSHGVTRDSSIMAQPKDVKWYYEQIALGFNYRMTDIQATLGVSQLRQLDHFLAARNSIFDYYNSELRDLPLKLPIIPRGYFSSCHLYIPRLVTDRAQEVRDKLYSFLSGKGIECNLHYIPVFLHPYYKKMGFRTDRYINALEYYNDSITLPLYVGVEAEQDYIVGCVRAFFRS